MPTFAALSAFSFTLASIKITWHGAVAGVHEVTVHEVTIAVILGDGMLILHVLLHQTGIGRERIGQRRTDAR